MSLEHGSDEERANFIAENHDSQIGKPWENNREATQEEKTETDRDYTDKVQSRVDQMRSTLEDYKAKSEAMGEILKWDSESKHIVDEQAKTIREYLQLSDELAKSPDEGKKARVQELLKLQDNLQKQSEAISKRIEEIRADKIPAQPIGANELENLRTKISSLEDDIKRDEEILEANTNELENI